MGKRTVRTLATALVCLLAGGCATDGGEAPAPNTGGLSAGGGLAGRAANAGFGGGGFGGQVSGGGGGVAGNGGARAESGGGGSGGRAGQAGASGGGAAGAGAEGGTASGATGGSSAGANSAGGSGNAGGSNASGFGGHAGNDGPGGTGGIGGMGGHAGEGKAITIWIAGDSTVANASNCPIGWGAMFANSFDERVTVTNRAVGGRSVRTWMYNVGTSMDASGECVLATDSSGMPTLQPRWQEMLDGMQSGDYLFIQFGINDGSATCDRHVGIEAFKDTYGVLAAAAKARGTQPVFVTPVSAIACNGTSARGTRGGFVDATLEAGVDFDVPVIDLHQLSVDLYNELGFCPIPGGSDVSASTGGEVGAFFCDDHTHFDRPGAERIAELVATAVATQALGLTAYLK
jgi:lysophospholipase L1-like esterase